MKLAPIGISTYIRIEHLKKTIKALQQNTLATESDLYIFSDYPKRGDEEKVTKVREYILTINGFKNIFIVERNKNNRVANNRKGMNELLDNYGCMIWLEEDIVTASGFLEFMNSALEFYENDDNILSISGYCPPIEMDKMALSYDAFIIQRFSAWGFASWRKKFNPFMFELKMHGIEDFLRDKQKIKYFMENGDDMYKMLLLEYRGEIDALDVKLMYFEFKYNLFTLYPVSSLVQNIGHDGTGVHCGLTNKFLHDELWSKNNSFKFSSNPQVDENIRAANFSFRKIGFKGKSLVFLNSIGVYPLIKFFKDKLK